MRINATKDLADAVRGRRRALGLSQATVAARARVSRPWLSQLEAGKRTTEFGLVLRLLDALGLVLEVFEESRDPSRGETVDLDAHLDGLRMR